MNNKSPEINEHHKNPEENPKKKKDNEIEPNVVPQEFPEENPVQPEIEEPGNVPIIKDYFETSILIA